MTPKLLAWITEQNGVEKLENIKILKVLDNS